ncbi:MAG: hypothetical protein WD468_01880 [Pirellulales bacterium]
MTREIAGELIPHKHLRRGRGRQRQQSLGTATARELHQLEIVGAEVVPPFRDAMCLVHREQPHAHLLDSPAKPLILKPLGSHVEQPQRPAAHLLQDALVFIGRQRRVEPGGGDAACGQGIDLVLHQGD